MKRITGSGGRVYLGVFAAIAVTATLLYYPSLSAPWYLDDSNVILQNPQAREIGALSADLIFNGGPAIFSFAINYQLGATDPFGYHLVNLALHIACGWLVFLLLQPTVKGGMLLPALGALLFVAHPLQTQAVTYIVQRMTLLSALFFLLVIWLFTKAREQLAEGSGVLSAGHLVYYLGALAAGLLALSSKGNAAVLPLVLYLYVAFFLPSTTDRKRLVLTVLPFAVAPLIFAVVRLVLPMAGGASLVEITRTTDLLRTQQLSPLRYLVTEFSVLWVYIRFLFFPYGQALDHSYPLARNLFELRHLLAGAGLVVLGALSVRLRQGLPLISAGIGWFFLTLAVESSIIPLDPLFEHRLYLPMFGFVLVVFGLLQRLPGRSTAAVVMALAIVLCLPLSWQRNRLWADAEAFFKDNVVSVPHSERAHIELANLYLNSGRLAEAEPLLIRALELNPDSLPAYVTLVAVYNDGGRLEEAITLAHEGLRRYPRADKLLTYLGALYFNVGNLPLALQTFDRELAIHPQYLPARTYRAKTLAALGRWSEAEAGLRQVLDLDPSDLVVRNDLAFVLMQQGKFQEADEELRRTVAVDPDNRDALFGSGLLAISRGDLALAAELVEKLRPIDLQRAQQLERAVSENVNATSDR